MIVQILSRQGVACGQTRILSHSRSPRQENSLPTGIQVLRKIREDYDPSNKTSAVKTLMEAHEKGEVLTGVFYVDTEKPTFTDLLNLVDQPLSSLPESVIRPSKEVLDKVMASLQ